MKNLFKIWLRLTVVPFLIIGCNEKESNNAVITITSTQPHVDVIVSRYQNLYRDTLVLSKTDSLGVSKFELPVNESMLILFQIGKKYGEVYLSPGDKLVINETGVDYTIPLTFSGQGAEINNYISWVNSNVEKIKWKNGIGIIDLEVPEFLWRFDSLKSAITAFHEHYIDSVALPDEIITMLENKNQIKFSAIGQEYKFFRLNNQVNERWNAYDNGQQYMAGTVSPELEDLTNEIPFDTVLLNDSDGDYQILLNYYWRNKIQLPVEEMLIGPVDSLKDATLMTHALIKTANYPPSIREFLIAFNLEHWLSARGITPKTDSMYTDLKRTYPASRYLPAMTRRYNEWLAVATGSPAPEFEGYTPDGKKISIKDLKGKIVYVDVWATWCGPCVAEIPFSKKLQEELKNDDRIQFLNVSIDTQRSAWEQFLEKDKAWKGHHIILDPEKNIAFSRAYKLFGVPDYILIDQRGNIVTVKAPRPSDKNIRKEIQQLLTKG